MKYKVAIEETLRKVIDVEAETPGLAVCQAEDEYNEQKHVLGADDFAGADISLAHEDTDVQRYLQDQGFLTFVERRFDELQGTIALDDKIRIAFGSMDCAMYEYEEFRSGKGERLVYLLYRCDALCSTGSMELIAPFSSEEMLMEYMGKSRKLFNLTDYDLAFFREQHQTQGRDTNYIAFGHNIDPVVEAANQSIRIVHHLP